MKKIPRIIGVERIEDKPDLWRVKLYTEVTVFLTSEVLFSVLLKQQKILTRTIKSFIKKLVKEKDLTEEQVIIKLIYVLGVFPPFHTRYLSIIPEDHCFVIKGKGVDIYNQIYTEIRFDTGPEGVLLRFTDYNGNDIPWLGIGIKDLINVIWQI